MMPDPAAPHFTDPNNPLLTKVPVMLETGSVQSTAGVLAVLCIRDASGTKILMLTKAELGEWIAVMKAQHDQMSGTKLITGSPGQITGLRGNGAHG